MYDISIRVPFLLDFVRCSEPNQHSGMALTDDSLFVSNEAGSAAMILLSQTDYLFNTYNANSKSINQHQGTLFGMGLDQFVLEMDGWMND